MTWDPVALFSDYLKCISSVENDKEETDDSISMDLFEVEFSMNNSFSGSLLKTVYSSCETLKLKAKLSPALSWRVFADHYTDFIDTLPFQEYTNPDSGILNLVAKSAEDSKVTEFSPHLYIACGSAKEIQRGGLVTELRINSHDLVSFCIHIHVYANASINYMHTPGGGFVFLPGLARLYLNFMNQAHEVIETGYLKIDLNQVDLISKMTSS